jgi:hypothetical protein
MLIDADEPYRAALEGLVPALAASLERVLAAGPIDLSGTSVSEALILRLGSFYTAQEQIKLALGKRYIGAGADFFVESVLFYLRAVFQANGVELEAVAERTLRPLRGSMRPDISIWRADECVAIVECKTQLGWARNEWKDRFAEREARLAHEWPAAEAFLLVMTNDNWAGFGEDPLVGTKYFVLADVWPSKLPPDEVRAGIVTPLEALFGRIVQLAGK